MPEPVLEALELALHRISMKAAMRREFGDEGPHINGLTEAYSLVHSVWIEEVERLDA